MTTFTACQRDQLLPDESITKKFSEPDKELYQKLIEVGFDKRSIQDIEEYYLVNDWLFKKHKTDTEKVEKFFAKIEETDPHRQTEQARTPYSVSSANVEVLAVYTDHSVYIGKYNPDNWSNAIDQAMAEWSSIPNTKIAFYPTSGSSYRDIIVKSDNGILPNNVIAAASFPSSDGSPGFEIMINLDFYNNMTVSESVKKYNMVHELGHCLGLRHTNWQQLGEPSAIHISGTPSSDGSSVMNGATAFNSWQGFSTYDRAAARLLYPYGPNEKIVTFPDLKMRIDSNGEVVNPSVLTITGSIDVEWNTSYFASSTVTIQLYHQGQPLITYSNVPNDGDYVIPNPLWDYGPYQIRIYSGNVSDMTTGFQFNPD